MVVVAGTMAAMARDFCDASWAIPRPTLLVLSQVMRGPQVIDALVHGKSRTNG